MLPIIVTNILQVFQKANIYALQIRQHTLPPVDKAPNEFSIPHIAETNVLEMIRELDVRKTTDLDDIPAKIL